MGAGLAVSHRPDRQAPGSRHFTTMNLFEFAGTLFGGLLGYCVVRMVPLSTPKVEDKAA